MLATDITNRGERRYAELLTQHGIAWQHHPPPFPVDAQRYQPDFFLPQFGIFIEVMGTRQRWSQLRRRLERFRLLYPTVRLDVVDPVGKPYPHIRMKKQKRMRQKTQHTIRPVGGAGSPVQRPQVDQALCQSMLYRLEAVRASRGWTYRELGVLLNVPMQTVYAAIRRGRCGARLLYKVERLLELHRAA